MSHNKIRMSNTADFTIKYEQDGRDYTWTGKGQVTVDREAEYDNIGDFGISRVIKTSERTTVMLDNVTDFKGRAVVKKEENVETVKTTRMIVVEDFTFGSIAAARKKVGAPKDSTFVTETDYNTAGTKREKTVRFTWDEVL